MGGRIQRTYLVVVLAAAVLGAVFVASCSPQEPLRLGFLGGVSGRVADLGIAGRDGALLAVEQRNARGGVGGRPVSLVVEDDRQDPVEAGKALERLIANPVEAVVGPMTSSIAVAVVPQANAAGLTLVAPTVTTNALTGIDDQFFRVVSPTAAHVAKSANYHYHARGLRRAALAFDLANKAYTESWANDFRQSFTAAGGRVVHEEGFDSGKAPNLTVVAAKLLDAAPDSVVIIANSVDTALLIQKLRQFNPKLAIATAEWAATERLIELGGRTAEGVVVAQYVDRDSTNTAYVRFHDAYVQRFGREPGFGGLTAFDAANVLLDALEARQPGQTLKEAILARREFAGAQSVILFDAAGDTRRDTYLSEIREGRFKRLDW